MKISLIRFLRKHRLYACELPNRSYSIWRIPDIRFESSQSLVIRYQLHAFNRVLESAPESSPALYLTTADRLIFLNRNSEISWSAIARELAIAMLPDHDPGSIAAGIKEVLAAESSIQADRTLDELGYPRLDTTSASRPQAVNTITNLGTEGPTDETVNLSEAADSVKAEDTPILDSSQAAATILDPATPKSSQPHSEIGVESTSGRGNSTGQKEKKPAKKNRRPVLRSYLPSPSRNPETSDRSAEDNHLSLVDEAGISLVLTYERNCGRIPTEMDHNHPGYDIESRDEDGTILRYIEVKSLSGKWRDNYAVLSETQFKEAYRRGNKFWLYVVDRVQCEEYCIYRIQSPARQANHFMFDDGWWVMAEVDETKGENLEDSKGD